MTPYYQDEQSTIYCGDCREILPELGRFDLLLTDPPYGLGDKWNGGRAGKRSSWKIPVAEAKQWDMQTSEHLEDAILQADVAIVWGGNYYSLKPARCWLIWDKKQPDTWTTGQAEMAWTTLDRTVRVFRMAQCEAHAPSQVGIKRHPAQKPIALIKWCFKWAPDAESIIDPFMGSGTTLVAAKLEGRKAVGIELEERYCEIAAKRLAQGVLF